MTKVTAQLNNLRIAPRKVRLVVDRIRGQRVTEAMGILKYDLQRAAGPIQKLLKSAVANAQNNFKLKSEDLYVASITVGEGPTLKRWTPRAYGRATKILKRTSHISIVLSNDYGEVKENNSQEAVTSDAKKSMVDKKSK